MRAPCALRVPGDPQHPPVLRHQEGREEEAEAHGQQGQGRAGGARQEVNNKLYIDIDEFFKISVEIGTTSGRETPTAPP